LAEQIKNNIEGVNVEFIKGSGGDFEVLKDGQLIFSKRKEGRFPVYSEILSKLS
jgi:selT/selW/selH-like putative selenoprotein